MDFITKSSGLHHILENVFMELDQEHLKICEKVHPIWRHLVLNKSLKWYSKKLIQNCHNLTKKDKSDWMELINKLICNCNPQQKTYMKQFFYDFSYRIDKFSSVSEEIFAAIENGMDDFIQIIAPYIENLAAKHYSSKCWIPTPFHHATRRAIETMDSHEMEMEENRKYKKVRKYFIVDLFDRVRSRNKIKGLKLNK